VSSLHVRSISSRNDEREFEGAGLEVAINFSFFLWFFICRLVFRGEPNDSAVLCTEDATYEVKDTETSNSLLVLEELSFPEQARRTSGSTNSSGSSTSPDSLSSVPIISFESANGLKQPEDQKEDNNGDTLLEMETVVRPVSAF